MSIGPVLLWTEKGDPVRGRQVYMIHFPCMAQRTEFFAAGRGFHGTIDRIEDAATGVVPSFRASRPPVDVPVVILILRTNTGTASEFDSHRSAPGCPPASGSTPPLVTRR